MAKKPTTDKSKNGIKSDKIKLEDRIRHVQDLIFQGMFTKDIVKEGMKLWNVSDRTVYTYINTAFEQFKDLRQKDVDATLARHIETRWHLYKSLLEVSKNKRTGKLHKDPKVMAELRGLLQDIARL